jgi:hypothetical protein
MGTILLSVRCFERGQPRSKLGNLDKARAGFSKHVVAQVHGKVAEKERMIADLESQLSLLRLKQPSAADHHAQVCFETFKVCVHSSQPQWSESAKMMRSEILALSVVGRAAWLI